MGTIGFGKVLEDPKRCCLVLKTSRFSTEFYPPMWMGGLVLWCFSSPILVFSPSVLPSSPLVCVVGQTRLQLSERQVEQVQHSNPPSLSRTFPTPHTPRKERERETQAHTERKENRDTVGGSRGREEQDVDFCCFSKWDISLDKTSIEDTVSKCTTVHHFSFNCGCKSYFIF